MTIEELKRLEELLSALRRDNDDDYFPDIQNVQQMVADRISALEKE